MRRVETIMLGFGHPLLFGAGRDASIHLRNCALPKDGFAWSIGRWCELEFDLDLGRQPPRQASVEFTLDLDVFKLPPAFPGQNVLLYLNGLRVGSNFINGRMALTFRVRPDTLLPTGNVLAFDLPDAARPLEFGMEDGRMLGVQMFSLAIDMVD